MLLLSFAANVARAEEVLTWEKCIQEARTNHPDLLSAQESVNQSLANKAIARSDLLPQISSGGSSTRSETGKVVTAAYTYSFTGSQLLFDGFKSVYDVISADKTARSALYNQAVTSSNVRLDLRTAFVKLLKAQAFLEIAKEIAQRRKQNAELLQLRYDAGKEHRGSLLTVKADLARAEFEVAQAERDLNVAQRRLNKEIGRTHLQTLKAEGDFHITYPDQEKPDFEKLAESTPFLRDLVEKKEAARYNVKSAKADFFPSMFVDGSFSQSDTNFAQEDETWSVKGRVSFPIFEGGSRIETLKKNKSAFRQAMADERSGRNGVIFTIEETWAQLQDAIDTIKVEKQFLEATEERAKITQSQYSNGLVLFDNWIVIEDDLAAAKKSFLSAQTNALIAEADWIQVKGGTLEYDEKHKD